MFLESRAFAILHCTLFLSCPAGTTIPSHLPPPQMHTHTHIHVDVCACAGSSASTMPLYGCMTHRPACPTGVDFHSWSPLLRHIFPSADIMSCHAKCLLSVLNLTYNMSTWLVFIYLHRQHKYIAYIHNVALPASHLQCAFQQTRSSLLYSELLNSEINAVRDHSGLFNPAGLPLFLNQLYVYMSVMKPSLGSDLDCGHHATTMSMVSSYMHTCTL